MFSNILGETLTPQNFIICLITSVFLGLIVALVHKKTTNKTNENFMTTLVLLPILVAVVILLVNGNLGTGIAVMGAFSLVRFRSIPGNSREIMNVFFAMAIGLAIGTGYIGFAAIFTVLVSAVSMLLKIINFGKNSDKEKILKIAVPEDIEYENEFNEIFKENLDSYELVQAKTVNMGSLFELTYTIKEKEGMNEKHFIDDLRIINGNLKISISHVIENKEVL